LLFMYRVCSWKSSMRLRLVEEDMIVCHCCMSVSGYRSCYWGWGLVFLLTGLVSCEIVLLHLNAIFTLVCSQTYKVLAYIKYETKLFPAVTLVLFCVSKSPPFNVTSLIAVQLACNSSEVVNILHPCLIRCLHINRFLFVTQSGYHAKYLH